MATLVTCPPKRRCLREACSRTAASTLLFLDVLPLVLEFSRLCSGLCLAQTDTQFNPKVENSMTSGVSVRYAFARVIASTGKSVAIAGIALITSLPAVAQGPIPWAASTKQPVQLTSPTSPAAVVFGPNMYVYYCDKNTNQMYGATTPSPSTNLTGFGATGISCGSGSTAMNATVYNGQVYVASNNITSGLVRSSDGHNFTASGVVVNGDYIYSYGLGIATFQNLIWLAYYGQHGSSVASSMDGVNFTYRGTISSLAPSNPSTSWQPGFSLAPSDDGSTLYVAYTSGSPGYMTVGHSYDGANWSTQQYTNSTFGHDPVILQYANAIWVLGQCVCNDHNFWATGAYDGVSFPASTKYGASLNNSPSAKEFQGALYTVFRSNFANDMWAWYAPN